MTPTPLRFCLMIQVLEIEDRKYTVAKVEVQVWQHDTYLNTVNVLDFVDLNLPKAESYEAVEQFAAATTRALARAVEEHFYTAVEADTITRFKDMGLLM